MRICLDRLYSKYMYVIILLMMPTNLGSRAGLVVDRPPG